MKKTFIFLFTMLCLFWALEAQVIKEIDGQLYQVKDIIPDDNAIIVDILNPDTTVKFTNSFLPYQKYKSLFTKEDLYKIASLDSAEIAQIDSTVQTEGSSDIEFIIGLIAALLGLGGGATYLLRKR